ncbi:hypothetical protein PR002_g9811 [Phytophthora rubi]|uniref:Uncharacterized protein n=1 Tax=Phytophthora rubi TaxID=129364 RepID=A0A6A3MN64_9STRA|nr:hypothetical protein PR002_g9811 [Phytophthora rubi]
MSEDGGRHKGTLLYFGMGSGQDYTNNNKLRFYIFLAYGPTAFGSLSSAFVTSPSKECYDLGGVVLLSPGPLIPGSGHY